ncbi:MAG: hypothetical protein WC998_06970 [Candidatus Paceibacterota bacterium]|jgi:DNA replication initiation complex subunit (GINS family)
MVNFRKLFIDRAVILLDARIGKLSDWEKKFFADIKERIENEWEISLHQYNKLMEIYNRIR